MRTALLTRLALPAALAFLGACSSDESATPEVAVARSSLARDTNPAVDAAAIATAVHGNDAFALDLAARLVAKKGNDNLFFSAHSVSTAFAMLYGGANGTTKADLAKTFHFTLDDATFHPAMNAIDLALESRAKTGGTGSDGKGFRLALENSFWGEKTTTWEAPYLDLLAKNYGAGINLVDFEKGAEASRTTINQWTEAKTEKRIKELLPAGSIDASTRFVLVNTVYFNAAWKEEFAPVTLTFTDASGGKKEVPAIRNGGDHYRYAKVDAAEIISVPYEGDEVELVVVMPDDLPTYEKGLDATKLEAGLAALLPKNLDLSLPKLKIEGATISLKEEISALGAASIFEAADLSGITKTDLAIDDVYHQAFLKLDEKGTEAAAATAIVAKETAALVDPPLVVTVNRPYLFFVRDRATGVLLFQGRVVSPQ